MSPFSGKSLGTPCDRAFGEAVEEAPEVLAANLTS